MIHEHVSDVQVGLQTFTHLLWTAARQTRLHGAHHQALTPSFHVWEPLWRWACCCHTPMPTLDSFLAHTLA